MVYILLGTGFEEVEAIAPCDILRRGGVEVAFAGIGGQLVTGSHGIAVKADVTVEDIDREKLDMIVLPGGLGGVSSMEKSAAARDVIRWAWEKAKFVGATCAGLMASAAATKTAFPRISITVPSIVIMVPGLYMYRAVYYMGVFDTIDAMEWIIRAVMIILFLPMGLGLARALTDPDWRYCS